MLILVRRGPTEPPSTVLQGNGSQVTVLKEPRQTNYSFRITGSTVIKVGGNQATLADLRKLENMQATVQFVPRRDGNCATSIESAGSSRL